MYLSVTVGERLESLVFCSYFLTLELFILSQPNWKLEAHSTGDMHLYGNIDYSFSSVCLHLQIWSISPRCSKDEEVPWDVFQFVFEFLTGTAMFDHPEVTERGKFSFLCDKTTETNMNNNHKYFWE